MTLTIGQAVLWPASPAGFAQVAELRRRTVRLCYLNTRGHIRQPIAHVTTIARLIADRPLLLRLDNPYARAIVRPRQRNYKEVQCANN